MLDFDDLEQLTAFARCGTLSAAAEELHISQPTITRTMQRLEDDFGAPLFVRSKNSIELNETGKMAVEYARKLIFEAENAVRSVREFDKNLRSVNVASCAPAPLWSLLPELSARFPKNTVTSQLMDIPEIIAAVSAGRQDIGILPFECHDKGLVDMVYIKEDLAVCVPPESPLAELEEVSFAELNGFNCLLRDQLGFWTEMCQRKMPASRFLIQTDASEFYELVKASTLLCFTTKLANPAGTIYDRKTVPISDSEAHITYHLICRPQKRELLPEEKK
jgi:Transcriptional regulator